MGFENYISESEAASQAGVSPHTLQRFADAGYLKVEIEPDGLRLYSRQQIHDIFGLSASLEPGRASTVPFFNANSLVAENKPAESSDGRDQDTTNASAGSQQVDTAQPQAAVTPATEAAQSATPAQSESPRTHNGSENSRFVVELEQELSRLRNLIKAQESLLDARDASLKDLTSQRDWLRSRVERLEEKSDRDQLLLLSETQTIRKLITLQEQRRSTMRHFLEWLGLASPTPAPNTNSGEMVRLGAGKTIEMKKAANE